MKISFKNIEFEVLSIIIEIYNAVKLINCDWVCATEKFNNQKEYSNVAIEWIISNETDKELVFGQVCLFIKFYIILLIPLLLQLNNFIYF